MQKFQAEQKAKEAEYLNNIGKNIQVELIDNKKNVLLTFPDGKQHEIKIKNLDQSFSESNESQDIDSIDLTLTKEMLEEIENIHLSDPNPCV